jgi:hypothetical protein
VTFTPPPAQSVGFKKSLFRSIRKTTEGRRFLKSVYDWLADAGVVKKPGEPGAGADRRRFMRHYCIGDLFFVCREADPNPDHQDVFSGLPAFKNNRNRVSDSGLRTHARTQSQSTKSLARRV